MDVNIDLITANGEGKGEVAQNILRQGGLKTHQMRPWMDPETGRSYITVYSGGDPRKPSSYKSVPITANATLRRDEWKQLDDAVLRVAEERLRGVQDLKQKGLTMNLNNAMGTTVLEYHDIAETMNAEINMDGVAQGENARPNYTTNYLPLPIVYANYSISDRILQTSRSMGNPMDTTMAERASRVVNETLENMLFTNTLFTYGGGTIYSYLNHPNRNKVTFAVSDGNTWDASAKTGDAMVDDVLAMKQASIDAHHYGPWMLYVPTPYETVLDEDYVSNYPRTVRERIESISGIQGVKVIDKLPADNILLVEMTTDVVRWINGMNIQNVEWQSLGGMVHEYKVMTIQVPQIRADQEGQSGLVHMASSHS
jgi:hypothetical protein